MIIKGVTSRRFPNLVSSFKKVTFPWSGGYFFVWSMYAIKIVTMIPRTMNTIESISKSLIHLPSFP